MDDMDGDTPEKGVETIGAKGEEVPAKRVSLRARSKAASGDCRIHVNIEFDLYSLRLCRACAAKGSSRGGGDSDDDDDL